MAVACPVELDAGRLRHEIPPIYAADIIVAGELSASIARDIDMPTG